MKAIRAFLVGSRAFFSSREDFVPKDTDEVCILDEMSPRLNTNVLHTNLHGKDIFFFRNMSKEEFIQDTIKCCVPMRVGKFLVPEFAAYLGMQIADLKKLESAIERLDEKHEYEKVIYHSYLENNGFFLTEEQLNLAYESYKSKRA